MLIMVNLSLEQLSVFSWVMDLVLKHINCGILIHRMHLFKVEFAIMMLQGICLKVEFVEFVIQILKKAAKLASELEARRQEAWAGTIC
jgi:hypothetical protein